MAIIQCPECGRSVSNQASNCPHCGYPLKRSAYQFTPAPQYIEDEPSTGLNILSFCFPLVGLVLYCVKQGQFPRQANAIGKWGIIGFCVGMFCWFLLFL